MALNGKKLLHLPGVQMVSLRDVALKTERMWSQIPGIAVVIIVGRRGDTENMTLISNNLPYETRREMVARVHDSFATGTLKTE
jgi:hypothetical protein